MTMVLVALAGCFVLWRAERIRRKRAEQLADRARTQGTTPCGTCSHYACNGVGCASCGGPCTAAVDELALRRRQSSWN